ncbi:MAG: hydrogen peroxide-dependent heme synthase [Ornithinimicrobium sp.]|jgi:chlorite dismutase|uniref:hydrogen peroxide-dependent heme synthase n=1 Tax=Ornithinimicrobium sp. TaxID=1977084 RepID=UPI003D9BD47C
MSQPATQHTPSPDQVEQINSDIRYAMYSVFRVCSPLEGDRAELADEVDALLDDLSQTGVVIRGLYDVSGLRADADLMIWWHAADVERVQAAYQRLRRTGLGRHLEPVWSQVAMHRPAEFNRGHVPAFLAGEDPQAYLCVYPFVRSYEWYVMDEGERRAMLKEHGLAARDYPDVRANTLSSFALGDYEWILAFEADELHRIVDLMRELRNTRARLHVREEVPFYTGPRVSAEQFVASAP